MKKYIIPEMEVIAFDVEARTNNGWNDGGENSFNRPTGGIFNNNGDLVLEPGDEDF